MLKALLLIPVFVSLFVITAPKAQASTMPSFTTCLAPNGTLKTAYDTGTHGIPGDTNSYSGSDKVYTVTDNYTMQCFCAENGTGVQTDWAKAGGFTEEEIKVYKNQGWIYIPNGADWGLSQGPYLAKNSSYSCKSSGGGSSSSTSSSSDSKVGGASASNNNNNGGSVLGLANTGNTSFIALLMTIGFASILFSLVLRSKKA